MGEPHGPYCALCGECQACADMVSVRCQDNRGGKHLWNSAPLAEGSKEGGDR